MSADPNESGDFEEFFQSGEQAAAADGPTKTKPEPELEPEGWGERPITAETRVRQARLRRLVLAIVAPLAGACLLILANRPWRAPVVTLPKPAPLGVDVDSARPTPLPVHATPRTSAIAPTESHSASVPAAAPVQSLAEPTSSLAPLSSPSLSAVAERGAVASPHVPQSKPLQASRPSPSRLVAVTTPRRAALGAQASTPPPQATPRSPTPALSAAGFPLE